MKTSSLVFSSVLSLVLIGSLSPLDAQTISVDKPMLSFVGQVGGSTASPQTVTVSSATNGLAFNAQSNVSWLKVTPLSGNTPSTLTVTADPTGLSAGTVSGALSIVGANTIQIPVTFTVGSLAVNPQSLQLAYTLNGSFPTAQNLTLSGPPVAYTAAPITTTGGAWLQVAPIKGQAPDTISVIVNTQVLPTLPAGTYSGAIVVTPANQAPITIPVTLTVSGAPAVTVNPASITFNFQTGQAVPAAQNVTVTLSTAQPLGFTLTSTVASNPAGKNWIAIVPSGITSVQGTAVFSVAVDPSGLPANTYTGKITLNSQGNPTSLDIPVTLVVSNLPLLNVPGTALSFTYQVGSAAPAAQPVTVTATSGTPSFLIATSANTPWLKVPAAGTSPAPFNVTVDPTGLAKGTYNGTVTVTGAGTGNGAQQIPVNLTVTNDPVISASVAGCSTLNQTCPLSIPFQIGGTNNPGATTLTLSSSTGATLNYTVTPSTASCGNWLMVNGGTSAVTGSTSSAVLLSASAAGIAAGKICVGAVTVAATNAATGLATPNSPVTVTVTLTVSSAAQLVAAPAGLTFTVPAGGQVSSPQAISLASTGADQLNYTVAFTPDSGGNWLSLNTAGGVTGGQPVIATATPTSLLVAGTYTGTLKITATGAGGAAANATATTPFLIPVVLQLTAGTLVVNSSSLSFSQTLGGTAPATQTLQITSNGQALNFSVAASNAGVVQWLTVTGATNGQTPGSATIAADGSKLSPGIYTGTVTVTAPGASNSGLPVQVTLTVSPGTISASPATLNFTQVAGGPAPPAQAVAVSGTPGQLGFTVATSTKDGAAWLTATPPSGTSNGNVQVAVNGGALAPGSYTGTVTITSAGAAGSPISIAVNLTVTASLPLNASPTSAAFSFIVGTATPPALTVQVTSPGANTPFTVATSTKDGGTWLTAAPTGGTTPASISIQVTPAGLAAGIYSGVVTVTSPNSITPLAIPVTLTVTAIPAPVISAIGNAASGAAGAVSAGENITIYGTNVGPTPLVKGQLNAAGAVDSIAGDTQVFFDNVAAPVIYASAGQTSVMVPYGVAGRATTTVTVAYKGLKSSAVTFNVVATAPGIYTLNLSGTGPGAILNQDLTVVTTAAPAPKSSVVAVYMTGEGLTPGNTDGVIATTPKNPVANVTATVGGLPAVVQYAGVAPGIVNGVMQVNVLIPATAPSGPAVAIVITVGGINTQAGVTLAIQ